MRSRSDQVKPKRDAKENRLFSNRLRFDQSVFWDWNTPEGPESFHRMTALKEIELYGAKT